jgi:hypothetical protein
MVLIKIKNCKLLIGVLLGLNKFTPVSVANDQLLCFQNHLLFEWFSWNKTFKSWRSATFASHPSTNSCDLQPNLFLQNRTNSNWLGATSLWRVFGVPKQHTFLLSLSYKLKHGSESIQNNDRLVVVLCRSMSKQRSSVIIRSGRESASDLSIKKYSCSQPKVAVTFLTFFVKILTHFCCSSIHSR